MKLHDRSVINRPPAAVWPFIITAEQFRQWNEKIVVVEASGAFHPGQTFHASYRMSGKRSGTAACRGSSGRSSGSSHGSESRSGRTG